MSEKDYAVAKEIYEKLCLPSDCCDDRGNLMDFDYVVAIDDDVTSAIYAVNMARQVKRLHGHYPTILCVGGKGILSRLLYDKSEAEVLHDACIKLGYPKGLVWWEGFETGRNTGENIQNITKFIYQLYEPRAFLFCVTKRQSLRYILTQRRQAPELNAKWCVIEESFDEACKLLNAKSLCGGEMMLHEIAAILPRCQQYACIYQDQIPAEVELGYFLMNDAVYLAKEYCLKLGGKPIYRCEGTLSDGQICYGIGRFGLKDYWRYIRLFVSLMWHKKAIMKAIDDAITMDNFNYGMTGDNLSV